MSELCNRLKNLRKSRGIMQKDVAKELGISAAAYSMYENGSREPSLDMIEKIANFFNVSPSYLIGWDSIDVVTDRSPIHARQTGGDTKAENKIINLFADPDSLLEGLIANDKKAELTKRVQKYFNEHDSKTTYPAAHFLGERFTKEELEEILRFAEFVKSKRE